MILYFSIDSLLKRFKTVSKVEDYIIEFYPELEIEIDEETHVMTIDGDIDEIVMFGNHQEDEELYEDEELEFPFMHPDYRSR